MNIMTAPEDVEHLLKELYALEIVYTFEQVLFGQVSVRIELFNSILSFCTYAPGSQMFLVLIICILL